MSIATRIFFLPALLALLLLAPALPARAASPADGGYIDLQVPDLPRAVRFFHDVLHCAPLDDPDTRQAALLDCGNGTIVALRRGDSGSQAAGALVTDDARAAAAWLRANHVRVISAPTRVDVGPGATEVVVTFLAPWGQPLRLVSRAGGNDPADAQLAAQ